VCSLENTEVDAAEIDKKCKKVKTYLILGDKVI
jgi:hypothetical protein